MMDMPNTPRLLGVRSERPGIDRMAEIDVAVRNLGTDLPCFDTGLVGEAAFPSLGDGLQLRHQCG